MSRVGKMPITIPAGVEVTMAPATSGVNITVKGPKGTIKKLFNKEVVVEKKEKELILTRTSEVKEVKALHGTYRALLANMITGVSTGFIKTLNWEGVGYRMAAKGKGLTVQMGYSHDVDVPAVDGITFKVENNSLTIEGVDKEVVGQVAANIREIRGPEPYKGKGIRYNDETIIRKAGKAAK